MLGAPDDHGNERREANELNAEKREPHRDEGVRLRVRHMNQRLADARGQHGGAQGVDRETLDPDSRDRVHDYGEHG